MVLALIIDLLFLFTFKIFYCKKSPGQDEMHQGMINFDASLSLSLSSKVSEREPAGGQNPTSCSGVKRTVFCVVTVSIQCREIQGCLDNIDPP